MLGSSRVDAPYAIDPTHTFRGLGGYWSRDFESAVRRIGGPGRLLTLLT